ncbi:murein L,D-transpeptidase catalytic domain family protein [Parvularcula maris]|uniref:Murein L,D-transpeptidase catalytic domain family protein n=1 Tax=Parvularcula maris TaxID=2965077 RepID=A0A9X2RJ88_9PROT|nr:murein L,D-transpeptidase catalytic domain family protein [Parvularcula maris]MCQ8184428.1 murein L,D-transpeptidase catalytic domain family protein [Parvularcula maris]
MFKRFAAPLAALLAISLSTAEAGSASVSTTAAAELHLQGAGLSRLVLAEALAAYAENSDRIANQRYIGVIDYSRHSSEPRFWLYDMETGETDVLLVAHGRNSDPSHSGVPTTFSNEPGSRMTSLGAYVTAETYHGKHGYSLRLDGLSDSNSRARERAIVIHGADYVARGRHLGRSWGCPALERGVSEEVIDKIKDGAFLYIHGTASQA